MFAFFVIIVIIGLLLEGISLKRDMSKVSVDFEISSYCTEPGVPFSIQTLVKNRSRVPLSYLAVIYTFSLHANLAEGLNYTKKAHGLLVKKICRIGGRRRKKLVLQTSLDKRGIHAFSADAVEFGDFLGFKEYSKNPFISREVVVYPKRIESEALREKLGRFFGDVAAKRFLIRDPILIVGTREYTGREPMKEVHWLKSAQRGELMVKEFDFNRKFSVSVLMSAEGISYSDDEEMDKMCELARAVCENLAAAGASVRFFSNAMRRGVQRGSLWKCEVSTMHMGALLEGLGRATSLERGTLDDLTAFALRESNYDSAYILLLPKGDARAAEASRRLSASTNQEVSVIQMEELA